MDILKNIPVIHELLNSERLKRYHMGKCDVIQHVETPSHKEKDFNFMLQVKESQVSKLEMAVSTAH